jgi:small multidrug resistance pump
MRYPSQMPPPPRHCYTLYSKTSQNRSTVSYFYLIIAIVAEVIATSALKATEEFSRLGPSLIVVIGYLTTYYFLTLSLRTIPVGIAYALWAGIGLLLVVLVAAVVYRQIPDWPAIIGMGLIISGVAVIHLFSTTVRH